MKFSTEERQGIWQVACELHEKYLQTPAFLVKISGGCKRWVEKRAAQKLKSIVVSILIGIAVQIIVKWVVRWIENNFGNPSEMPDDFAAGVYAV